MFISVSKMQNVFRKRKQDGGMNEDVPMMSAGATALTVWICTEKEDTLSSETANERG